MVKKTEHYDFDFPEWDDFGDNGEGGFRESSKKGGKRKAITEFGGSFLSGIKKNLLNKDTQRKFIENAMPSSGYTRLFDSAHMVKDSISDLSYSLKGDIRKVSDDFREPLKTLERAHRDNRFVPKKISEKIRGWESNSYGNTSSGSRKDKFDSDMAGIFDGFDTAQAASTVQTKKAIRESSDKATAVGVMNTKATLAVAQGINETNAGIGRLVAFNEKVTGRAMRKQLELQFKQYVTAREQLDVLQQMRDLQSKSFDSLVKNTGLPEAVKVTNFEMANQQLKRQLFGAANRRVANSFKDIGARMLEDLKVNASSFIDLAGVGLAGGLSGYANSVENKALDREMGLGESRARKAGNLGGQAATWLLSSYGGKMFNKKFGNNPNIKKYSDMLLNASDNSAHWFNRVVNERTDSQVANALIDILGLDKYTFKENPKVRGSAVPDLEKQAFFNVQSQLALTEVIPGHLRTMSRFLEIMATGNQDVETERYDYETGKFVRDSALVDRYNKRLFGAERSKTVKENVDNVIREMDTKNQLSPKAKRELRRHLLDTARYDQKNVDIRALISDDSPLSSDVADEVARVLGGVDNFNMDPSAPYDRSSHKDMFKSSIEGSNEYHSRTRNVNEAMRNLRDVLPNNMQAAIDISRQGHTDLLERIGAINYVGDTYNLDRQKEMDYYLSGGAKSTNYTSAPNTNTRSTMGPPNFRGPINPYMGGSKVSDGVFDQPTTTVGSDALQLLQENITAAIERNSTVDLHRISNELLDAIRMQLEMGINTNAGDSSDGTTARNTSRRNSWFSKVMTPFRKGLGGMATYTKTMYGKVIPGIVKAPFKLARSAWDGLKSLGGAKGVYDITAKKVKDTVGDVYAMGKSSPLLEKSKMVAGEYYDQATGKHIKTFKDIQGAVVDKEGKVVLTIEDFKQGLFTVRNGKPVRLLTGALGLAWKGTKGLLTLGTKPYAWMGRGLFGAAKIAGKMLFGTSKFQDVYVPGERSPRLMASVLAAGGYFNEDGSVIKSIDDIKGDIKDATGKVRLTLAEMTEGLVDSAGKPLESFKKKSASLLGIAGGASVLGAKAAWAIGSGAAKLYGKALRGMGRGAKGIFSSIFGRKKGQNAGIGGFDDFTMKMLAHQADKVDQIYDLLDKRLPENKRRFDDIDGDGLREGSRESWLSKLANRTEEKTDEKKPEDKKQKGIFGLLMAAVSGIGGLVGTLKGWASRIFGLMRATAMMRAGGSLMSGLGGLLGGLGGRRGRAGRAAGRTASRAARAGSFVKNNAGKMLGFGLLAGAAGMAFGGIGSEGTSAFNLLGKAEQEALKESGALSGGDPLAGADGGGSDQGGSGGFWDNLKNAVIGGVGGEAAAILGGMGLSALIGKVTGRKGGTPSAVKPSAKPTGMLGKAGNFLFKNKYGRLLTAGASAAGLYTGMNALTGDDSEVNPQTAALKSMGITMGIDAGLGYGVPWLMDKFGKGGRAAGTAAEAAQAASGVGTAATAAGAASKAGMLARLGGGLGKAARFAGKAAIPLTLAMGAMDAYNTEGTFGDKAGAFAGSVAPGLLGIGALKLAANPLARAAMWQGARSLAAGAGSLIAGTVGMPVALTAAAIAGAGYLGYKAYKRWFKKDKQALVRFRMAQYGFDLDKKERSDLLLQLEKLAMDCVTIKGEQAEFNKNLSAEKITSLFGILAEDRTSLKQFEAWFMYRFRPVFLKAYGVNYKITKKKDLHAADDNMAREEKMQYLQNTNSFFETPSPYKVTISPFPDEGKTPYSEEDVADAYKKAMRDVKKEKTRAEVDKDKAKDDLDKEVNRRETAKIDNRLDWEQEERNRTKQDLAARAEKSGSIVDKAKSMAYNAYDKIAGSIFGKALSNIGAGISDAAGSAYTMFTGNVNMSKSQKQWQMMVYKAFKTAGFSDMQSRILTAEVGRENSYNPQHLFGGHADPHRGANLGMISWQGDRRTRLADRLRKAGLLTGGDRIAPGQPALDEQARYVMWELRNTHAKAGNKFLSNPNIDYKTGADLIGREYIRWRIDDPKYRAGGLRNRDGFYNMLNQQLGAPQKNADSGQGSGQAKPANKNASSELPPYLKRAPGNPDAKLLTSDGKLNKPNLSDTGTAKQLAGAGIYVGPGAASGGGGTSGQAGALKAFLETLSPDKIKAGATFVVKQNNDVDLRGMKQDFMAIFYAMAYDYNQRTGKKIQVNSGYRSVQKQKQLYDAWIARGKTGGAVAKPGNSRHNSGVAIDINSATANELDSMGLLKKYSFHRPVRGEAWHLENHFFSAAKLTQDALKQAESGGVSDSQVENAQAQLDASEGRFQQKGLTGKASATFDPSTGKVTYANGTTAGAPKIPGVTSSGSTAKPATNTSSFTANQPTPTPTRRVTQTSAAAERSSVVAEATNRRQTEEQATQNVEQTNLMKQQVSLQTEMLKALRSIDTKLQGGRSQQTSQSQNFRSADVNTPVSMSVRPIN
jgi:hypothetical protein